MILSTVFFGVKKKGGEFEMTSIESVIVMDMIGGSICFAKEYEDNRYYMDFVKLHKLLYLAQCYSLAKYNKKLFDNPVVIKDSGAYIDGICFVPAYYGFGKIELEMEDVVASVLFESLRGTVVGMILQKYGKLSTDEIVSFTKNTFAVSVYDLRNDVDREIDLELMYATGMEICGDFD